MMVQSLLGRFRTFYHETQNIRFKPTLTYGWVETFVLDE